MFAIRLKPNGDHNPNEWALWNPSLPPFSYHYQYVNELADNTPNGYYLHVGKNFDFCAEVFNVEDCYNNRILYPTVKLFVYGSQSTTDGILQFPCYVYIYWNGIWQAEQLLYFPG